MRTAAMMGLVLAAVGIVCSVACSEDNDSERGSPPDCGRVPDPCDRCVCQVCACDLACQQALETYAQCIDACFSLDGGEAELACMQDCEAQTSETTRNKFQCAASAPSAPCAAVCQ